MTNMNPEFVKAVIAAARGFKAADKKDPSVEGRALAEYLKSDAPLGKEERELLSELVTGQWRRPNHRTESLKSASIRASVDILQKSHLRNGIKKSKNDCAIEYAESQNLDVERVINLVRRSKNRKNL